MKKNHIDITIYIALSIISVANNFKQVIKIQDGSPQWYYQTHPSLPKQEQHLLSQYDSHPLNAHVLTQVKPIPCILRLKLYEKHIYSALVSTH